MNSVIFFFAPYIPLSIIIPLLSLGCINDAANAGNSPFCSDTADFITGAFGFSPLAALISLIIVILTKKLHSAERSKE